jgi:hypothetical protein
MDQPDPRVASRGAEGDSEIRLTCSLCGWGVEAVTQDAAVHIFLGIPFLKEHVQQQHKIMGDDAMDAYGT